MKSNISLILAIFIIGTVKAQQPAMDAEMIEGGKGFSSGDIIVAGAVGFSQTSFDNEKNISIEFAPRAAYFVSDHFALGIAGGFNMTTIDDDDETGSDPTATKVSLGPLVRYYHRPASNFSFFGQVGFLYNTTNQNNGGVGELDFKTNGFEVTLSPGISYFISNHFAFEAAVGLFKTETVKSDLDDVPSRYITQSSFNFSALSIGLVYKL